MRATGTTTRNSRVPGRPGQRLSDVSREELYELVWSVPAARLAERFGVTAVAIIKHCQRSAVPRPGRGYWAKLEFGKKVDRPALPTSPAAAFSERTLEPIAGNELSRPPAQSHPLAAQLLERLKKAIPSFSGRRVHIRERELPETTVSKAHAERVAAAFDTLLRIVEARGIPFRRAQSKYDGGYFRKGHDRLYVEIEEELSSASPAPSHQSPYASFRQESDAASGRITVTLNEQRYSRQTEKRWTETDRKSLRSIIPEVAKEVCRHFVAMQKKRAEEVIQREKDRVETEIHWKRFQEEQAIRQKEEAKKKHEDTVEGIVRFREENLLQAAKLWAVSQEIERFVSECERRWRESQNGALTDEQRTWLSWASCIARAESPFEIGYPDPNRDGPFDRTCIPFGGPYPEKRTFEPPHSVK